MEKKYLTPTAIIDSDHPSVVRYGKKITKTTNKDLTSKAIAIFYAVRDNIKYDPYTPFYLPKHYKASYILNEKKGFCVCKASLLCALGRAVGIPSRVGFADVKNHLATKQLIEFLGSDLFVYHGFTEFYLNGKWIKATPTFNKELCKIHNVLPLEFNGKEDAVFHAFNSENKKYMEYLKYHGTYEDIPIETILNAWYQEYGKDRVELWKKFFEQTTEKEKPDFYTEDIVT